MNVYRTSTVSEDKGTSFKEVSPNVSSLKFVFHCNWGTSPFTVEIAFLIRICNKGKARFNFTSSLKIEIERPQPLFASPETKKAHISTLVLILNEHVPSCTC